MNGNPIESPNGNPTGNLNGNPTRNPIEVRSIEVRSILKNGPRQRQQTDNSSTNLNERSSVIDIDRSATKSVTFILDDFDHFDDISDMGIEEISIMAELEREEQAKELLEAKKDRDEALSSKFGMVVEMLSSRTVLSRSAAAVFILLQLYRGLALALIIL